MSAQPGPDVGHRTDRGRKRQRNEDSYGLPPPDLSPEVLAAKGRLYVVADGVGGHRGGEEASRIAVQRIVQEYYRDPSPDWRLSLTRAVRMANAQIFQTGQRTPGAERMATTVTAAALRGQELLVANVGDSRTYVIRGGVAQQLTQDHSLVADALRQGTITPEQASTHPYRSQITRALGKSPDVQADLTYERLQPGDRILLCSDGLNDELDDGQIAAAISRSESAQDAASRLVGQANHHGGRDNVTAVVVGLNGRRPASTGLPPLWLLVAGGGLLLLMMVSGLFALLPGPTPTPSVVSVVTTTLPMTEAPTAEEETTTTQAPAVVTPTPAPVTPTPVLEVTEPAEAETAAAAEATQTAIAEADMTATALATDLVSAAPTETMTPEATATGTPEPPSPAPTKRPRPTSAPTPDPRPANPRPRERAKIKDDETIELRWDWAGELKEDEHFDVRVWRDGQVPEGIAWVESKVYRLKLRDHTKLINPDIQGTYYWSIVVVQGSNGNLEKEIAKSEVWTFDWEVSPWRPRPTEPVADTE